MAEGTPAGAQALSWRGAALTDENATLREVGIAAGAQLCMARR